MSFLASLISSKKSQLSKDKKKIGKKWVRRGEIKKLREKEQEEKVKRLKRERQASKIDAEKKRVRRKLSSLGSSTSKSGSGHAGKTTQSGGSDASVKITLPIHEVKRRLRLLKVPVTLFGETELMRYKRMRRIEIEGVDDDQETKLDAAFATRNVFLKNKQDQMDENENEEDDEDIADPVETPRAAASAADTGTNAVSPRSKKKDKKDRAVSNETHILRFWRGLLREWQADLAARPEEVKNSAAGRNATKTQKQCKDYMRPFLKMCRAKSVEADILEHVRIIVRDCEKKNYVHAHEQYMRLAIGNAPWPIGVTSVGIHERAARERINVAKIAHVLNDECQRKYVTSMKRLMTYCQTKYPTNPSQMVIN